MGNLHAQKKEFVSGGEVYVPLVTHLLKKDIISFKCDYRCGSFFNHTLQFFKSCKECDDESIFIKPAPIEEFDYYIEVSCAHAVTLLDSKK